MPTIRVDEEVWRELQKRAEPFVDNPNAVLRRVLGVPESSETAGPSRGVKTVDGGNPPAAEALHHQPTSSSLTEAEGGSVARPRRSGRALPGTILGQGEYRQPILDTLAGMGGEGVVAQILDAVYEKVKDRLTPLDHELVPSGADVRWRIQAMFQRKKMILDGLLDSTARSGIWRLAQGGWKAARTRSAEDG